MLTEAEKKIVLAYAKCNMNAVATGRVLHYSNVTINYHLDRIQDKTGLDPRRFYDLIKLVQECGEHGDEE